MKLRIAHVGRSSNGGPELRAIIDQSGMSANIALVDRASTEAGAPNN
jgi:hypothetical protein